MLSGQNSFQVKIELDSTAILVGYPVLVKMHVTNIGSKKATFCQYHTPFEGIQNNIFNVWRKGKVLPYQGIMKKRIPPSEDDYLTIKAVEEVSCSVELEGYDLSRKGTYKIQFEENMISGLPSSNTIAFTID